MRGAQPSRVRTVASASGQSIRAALEVGALQRSAEDAAQYLTSLDDETFAALVERDLRGELPSEAADIFGHVDVCHRWMAVLKSKSVRATQVHVSRNYRTALAERRAAAVHAIARSDKQSDRRGSPAQPGKSPRGRAIDRLIEAHFAEFRALVIEEEQAQT